MAQREAEPQLKFKALLAEDNVINQKVVEECSRNKGITSPW